MVKNESSDWEESLCNCWSLRKEWNYFQYNGCNSKLPWDNISSLRSLTIRIQWLSWGRWIEEFKYFPYNFQVMIFTWNIDKISLSPKLIDGLNILTSITSELQRCIFYFENKPYQCLCYFFLVQCIHAEDPSIFRQGF